MGFILALIVAAIVLVILGILVETLKYLLIIGIVVAALALIYGAVRSSRRSRRVRR